MTVMVAQAQRVKKERDKVNLSILTFSFQTCICVPLIKCVKIHIRVSALSLLSIVSSKSM